MHIYRSRHLTPALALQTDAERQWRQLNSPSPWHPGCDLVHCGYLESKLVVESPQQKTRTLFWFLKKLYKNRKISYLYCRRLRFLCLLLFTGNSLRISNSLGEPQLHLAHNHIEQVLMNMYVNILVITKHTWARNVNFTLSYSISRI